MQSAGTVTGATLLAGDEAGTLLPLARVSVQSAGTVTGAILLAEARQKRCADRQDLGAERIRSNFQGRVTQETQNWPWRYELGRLNVKEIRQGRAARQGCCF